MTMIRVICKGDEDAKKGVLIWLKAADVPVSLLPGDEYEFEIAAERGLAICAEPDDGGIGERPVEWR